MNIFNLPDLGEGLADAEIREWHVRIGDEVKLDQPLVCVETAKAIVEVPSPQAGRIKKIYGDIGNVINTGAPLVEFESDASSTDIPRKDQGSVVGSLEENSERLNEDDVIIGAAPQQTIAIKAMPAVRALAKQLQVDLSQIMPTGAQGQITADDIKKFAANQQSINTIGQTSEALRGVRRAMALAMTQSHQEVVPVSIIEDADLSALPEGSDVTICLIKAIASAIKAEPALNAWYDGKTMERRLFNEVNLGLAMDTPEGLFVPVLKDAGNSDAKALRTSIENFKKTVKSRVISPGDLQGATFTLSNFGMIAGRYATPVIVPPMVAILACGKIDEAVVARQGKIEIRRMAPLSLTFDHRAVTGGEATRFLAALIKQLESNGNVT